MNGKAVSFAFAVLFLAVSAARAQYLQLQGKRISLSFDDRNLSFYVENPSPEPGENRYLLFRDDPPTSYITLSYNDKFYRFTEPQVAEVSPFTRTETAIEGTYRIQTMLYRIRFLLTNLNGREYDSIMITVSANSSRPGDRAGARFLFDTTAGEDKGKPTLFLSSTEAVTYERLFQGDTLGNFVLAGDWEADSSVFGKGLFIYPYINEIHQTQALLGNWKRLDMADGTYKVDQDSRFRYNPYSLPDAAVAIFHSVAVREDETDTFGCVLSRSFVHFTQLVPPVTAFSSQAASINSAAVSSAASVSSASAGTTASLAASITSNIPPVPVAVSNVATTGSAASTAATNPLTAVANTASSVTSNACSSASPAAVETDPVHAKELALLSSQSDTIEKLNRLLERIDATLSSNAPGRVSRTVGSFQGITSIGGSSQDEVARPFYPVFASNTPSISNSPQPVQPINITNALPQFVVVTNDLSKTQLDQLHNEMEGREKEYNDKIAQLSGYYQQQISNKEEEFKRLSEGYRDVIDSRERKKERDKRLTELDATVQDLNAKLLVVEKLLSLDLDFKSMPDSKLKEIADMIDSIAPEAER
jgi:hypothetical protein